MIYSIALRSGLNEADASDVFQEVCILLLDHLVDLRDVSRLSGWIASTTKRASWRLKKRNTLRLESEQSEAEKAVSERLASKAADEETPEEALITIENRSLVENGLNRLNEKCRSLLTLLYADSETNSYTDIAEKLNMPLGSIGPNRARCLQSLQKILEEIGF